MKGLLKLAFLTGLGAVVWKNWQGWTARPATDDRGPAGSSGIVRDAGPAEQQGIEPGDWDLVDEQADESFPASDPPGNFRGVS
ncbi:hypothetical protein WG907_04955 [Sphingobium sp. AN558]|uniref:hypothetical protein n=1 Tax=Sphingobium sp. AN558 TaxID=3133442 RepID=UPI0030C25EA3